MGMILLLLLLGGMLGIALVCCAGEWTADRQEDGQKHRP